MANYPIKMLVDEQGHEFVPISSTDALINSTGQSLDTILAKKLETSSILAGSGVSLNKDTTNNTVTINCSLPGATVIDNLTTTTAGQGSLDAHQGYVLNTNKVNISDIVDNCTTTANNKPLSAYQGYVLFNKFNDYALTSAIPTSTSQLTNNGSDGTHSFISNYSNGLDVVLKAQISGSEVDLEYGVPNSGGTAYIYSGVQKKLVSGTNIKTINGTSVLGSGNISILDLVYPIGSIYMSVQDVSPATFIGGTWERLKDRFLLGAGDTYTAGNTGGSATTSHTHNVPGSSHAHNLSGNGWAYINSSGKVFYYKYKTAGNWTANYSVTASSSASTSTTFDDVTELGGRTDYVTPDSVTSDSTTVDNMPPYLVVYMWKRTA